MVLYQLCSKSTDMKHLIINTTITLIFVSVILTGLFIRPTPRYNDIHTCRYEHCPYKGLYSFDPYKCDGQCEPGSDCYCLDEIHFEHPELDYDGCEDLLFANN